MPRPKTLKPAYCLHKASGRAYVKLDGQRHYLGRHGTQESRDAYDCAVAEWIARGRRAAVATPEQAHHITVAELIHAFWCHATEYYRTPAGGPGGELENYRTALRPLRRLYGSTPVADFGPLALKALRAAICRPRTYADARSGKLVHCEGWTRKNLNRQVSRLKHVFGWGVSEQIVPVAVYQALLTVKGLRAGKSDARETDPVGPLADVDIEAVLTHLSPKFGPPW